MSKILLVEDDTNLSEIYAARLQAEGFEVVAAHNGEEALASAVKEQPDLIILDVMMPKISGFDVLDILRQTPETKNTRVIMMTALSQKEDQERGKQLGADKYLVKSQVTLEDVVASVREVLTGKAPQPQPAQNQPQQNTAPTQPQTTNEQSQQPQQPTTQQPAQPQQQPQPAQNQPQQSTAPTQPQSSPQQQPGQSEETNQELESEINQILGLDDDNESGAAKKPDTGDGQQTTNEQSQQPQQPTTQQPAQPQQQPQPAQNQPQQSTAPTQPQSSPQQQPGQSVQPGASINPNEPVTPQPSQNQQKTDVNSGKANQQATQKPQTPPSQQDDDGNQQTDESPDSIAL